MVFIHQHKRKRAFLHKDDLEPFPHHQRYFQFLDKAVYILAVIGPLVLIPQVYEVWVVREVAGVSALTWFLLTAINVVILLYTVAHKDIRLTVMYSLYTTLDLAVAIGALIFA